MAGRLNLHVFGMPYLSLFAVFYPHFAYLVSLGRQLLPLFDGFPPHFGRHGKWLGRQVLSLLCGLPKGLPGLDLHPNAFFVAIMRAS